MKKWKTNQKKQIKKTIVFLLVLLSTINLAVYPESFSKYVDNKALVYQANLYQLYAGEITMRDTNLKSTSSFDKVKFSFKFEQNGNISVDPNTYLDEYLIKEELPKTCKITSITSGNKTGISQTIAFQKEDNKNVPITVHMECDVDAIIKNNELIVQFPIYEHVNDDEENFIYKDVNIKMNADEYYAIFKKPEAIRSDDLKTLTIPNNLQNKNSEFQRWLIDFAEKYKEKYLINDGDISAIVKYGTNVFTEQKEFALKGMSVDCNTDSTKCVYKINSENFVGYAKTLISATPSQMFFTGIDTFTEPELDDIFFYYLKNHVYPESQENAQTVYDYVLEKSQGLKNVISGNTTVLGLTYNSKSQSFMLNKQILDFADMTDSISIEIGDYATMEGNFSYFLEEYINNHSEIFTNNIVSKIWNDEDLWDSITKNKCPVDDCSTSFELTPYNNYFILKDDQTGEYVIINIFSVASGTYNPNEDNSEYKTVGTFRKFEYSEDLSKINIQFINSENNRLVIKVTGDTKENILKVIKALDNYFQTTTLEADIRFTANTQAEYEIDTRLMKTLKLFNVELAKPEVNNEVQNQKEEEKTNIQAMEDVLNIPVTQDKEPIKEFYEENKNTIENTVKNDFETESILTTEKDEAEEIEKKEDILKKESEKNIGLLLDFIFIDFRKLWR